MTAACVRNFTNWRDSILWEEPKAYLMWKREPRHLVTLWRYFLMFQIATMAACIFSTLSEGKCLVVVNIFLGFFGVNHAAVGFHKVLWVYMFTAWLTGVFPKEQVSHCNVAERRLPVLHVRTWKMQTWTIQPSKNADCCNEPNADMSCSGVWLSTSGSQPVARGCMSNIYALSGCLTLLFLMFVLTVSYLTCWRRILHQSYMTSDLTAAESVGALLPPRLLFFFFSHESEKKQVFCYYYIFTARKTLYLRSLHYVIASSNSISKEVDLFKSGSISLCHPEAALKVFVALVLINSVSLLSSFRGPAMGKGCITVTKYFLFLFNLLFFVSNWVYSSVVMVAITWF